jgi:hypothetical protein
MNRICSTCRLGYSKPQQILEAVFSLPDSQEPGISGRNVKAVKWLKTPFSPPLSVCPKTWA